MMRGYASRSYRRFQYPSIPARHNSMAEYNVLVVMMGGHDSLCIVFVGMRIIFE